MDTNENIRNDTSEDVIVLGVASTETQGGGGAGEAFGDNIDLGISEE